jgi:hypothetical protein
MRTLALHRRREIESVTVLSAQQMFLSDAMLGCRGHFEPFTPAFSETAYATCVSGRSQAPPAALGLAIYQLPVTLVVPICLF